MHGGQSIPMFEYDLAPYVVVSYLKHLSKVTCISMRCNDIDTSGLTDYGMEVYHKLGTIMSDEAELLIKDFLVTLLKENGYDCDDEAVAYILNESLMLTDRETYQAMEAVIHNLNSMQSRAGAQVPFSSINYGTGVTKEQRMIMRNVLLVTEAGLGGGETPVPCTDF